MTQTIPIIIDLGGYETKVGFAGNSSPLFSLNTEKISKQKIYISKTVKKYENLEVFYSKIFMDYLGIDPEEKNFILSESAFEDKYSRNKIMEIFFESFTVDKLALINDTIASLYSFKKQKNQIFDIKNMNGLLVETGHQQTSIVPIVEGHIIQHGIFNYPINGKFITDQIYETLKEKNPKLVQDFSNNQIKQMAQIFKHQYSSLELNQYLPKIESKQFSLLYQEQTIQLQIDELFQSPLNMYFEPQDFQKKISKNMAFYISQSINGCPFDVKNLVFKVLQKEYYFIWLFKQNQKFCREIQGKYE